LPLHDYQVYTAEGAAIGKIEKFFKPGREIPQKIELANGAYGIRLISLPAKTAGLWHAGWTNGMDNCGVYSAALGRNVANKSEEAKIMRSRGFIPESDLGRHFIEDTQEKLANHWDKQEQYTNKYKENLKTMSPEDAVAATWTAKECLDGTVDETYTQPLKGV